MATLRAEHVTMREELERYMRRCDFPRFHMDSHFADPERTLRDHRRTNVSNTWSTIWLRVWGRETEVAQRHFPRTLALVRASPLSTAMLSLLEPQRGVWWHRGFFNGVLRYHVSLLIPPVPPGDPRPRLLVHAQLSHAPDAQPLELEWSDGSDLLFDDTYNHSVSNPTSLPRVVLFSDVVRQDCPAPLGRWLTFLVHTAAQHWPIVNDLFRGAEAASATCVPAAMDGHGSAA